MSVSAVDISAAVRNMREADQHERLEQVDEDHVRVWWLNCHTYALTTALLSLDELAAFERGEVPSDLAEPECFTVAEQREAVEADQRRIAARRRELEGQYPELRQEDEK